MGSFSIVHWIIVLVILIFLPAIYLVPIAKILRKAGYSGWWCLITLIPPLNIIMLWVFASASWPNLHRPRGQPTL